MIETADNDNTKGGTGSGDEYMPPDDEARDLESRFGLEKALEIATEELTKNVDAGDQGQASHWSAVLFQLKKRQAE